VAAAAGAAGLGTFGSFTSSTSASASVSSSTVAIALGSTGTANNRLTVAASSIVPGDTIQRAVTLSNNGDALSSISLTTAATTSSKLDTDATSGLQLKIDSCATAWTESGTAPAYSYTCAGGSSSVLATRPVIGTNLALSGLSALTATKSDNLVVTLSFPTTADNTFQTQSSVIGFTFTGNQRTAASR
jgi:hypothetical protein